MKVVSPEGKVFEVSQKAYDLLYVNYGFKPVEAAVDTPPKQEEPKKPTTSKKTASKKKAGEK